MKARLMSRRRSDWSATTSSRALVEVMLPYLLFKRDWQANFTFSIYVSLIYFYLLKFLFYAQEIIIILIQNNAGNHGQFSGPGMAAVTRNLTEKLAFLAYPCCCVQFTQSLIQSFIHGWVYNWFSSCLSNFSPTSLSTAVNPLVLVSLIVLLQDWQISFWIHSWVGMFWFLTLFYKTVSASTNLWLWPWPAVRSWSVTSSVSWPSWHG